MPQDQALPTVEKGEALDAWLKRAVPVLMEQHGLDEQTATDLATQAWNQINGDAAGGEQPAAEDTAKPGAKPPAPKAKEAAADGTDKPADAAAYGQPAPNAAAGDGKDQPAAEGKKPPFPPKKKDAPAEGKNPDVAQQLTGKPPKAAATDKPEAQPSGQPVAPAGRPLVDAATLNQQGASKPKPKPGQQGMNWENDTSWGNSMDAQGNGMEDMDEGEHGEGRPPLDLGQVTDAVQLLENWVVANIAAYASSLVAALTATGRATEQQGQQVSKSIVNTLNLLVTPDLDGSGNYVKSSKATTLETFFEASLHRYFTDLADNLRMNGNLTRQERIALSSCIGDALSTFTDSMATKLAPTTLQRSPWADVEKFLPASEQFEFTTPLPDFQLLNGSAPDTLSNLPSRVPATVKSQDDDLLRDMWAARDGLLGPETIKAQMAIPNFVDERLTIKALTPNRVGSYLCIWGSPTKTDIAGEWFAQDTQELTAIFDSVGRVPAIYHHAIDDTLKSLVIGTVDTMKADDVGLWIEAQIQRRKEYEKFIEPLIDRQALGWSSGTLPMARRVNKATGKIERWPIVEASMTPQPAEYRMAHQWPVRNLKSLYLKAGLPADILDQLTGASSKAATAHQIALEMERLELLALHA